MIWSRNVPRRYGQFRLEDALFLSEQGFREAQMVLATVVVVRCEHMPIDGSFWYQAWCPTWEAIPPNERPPWYKPERDPLSQAITWTRCQNDWEA